MILWLLPRLPRTALVGGIWAMLGGALINTGIAGGTGAIAIGWATGMEYIEIPWQIGIFMVAGLVRVILPVLFTLVNRKAESLYVSAWYMIAAPFWITLLYIVAKLPSCQAAKLPSCQAAGRAHPRGAGDHQLVVWPQRAGTVVHPCERRRHLLFLPKIIGRPIRAYNLSLVGFWALAFFYGQVGRHHLIGGPVPGWLVTLLIVQSMMMIIPVVAFTINMALTMRGRMHLALYSPMLRFMMFGGLMYMASSLQGSFEALRSINQITHFTHFTVAHAHLGAYGFVTMVLFGAVYFMMPRVLSWEWPYPRLIQLHFWLAAVGIMIYFVGLSIGGWLQGLAMLDATRPFIESVTLTMPYLEWRSVGGSLMLLSHFVFVGHFLAMALRFGPTRATAALFSQQGKQTQQAQPELAHGK